MRSPTTYIYGSESGHLYWTGNDSLHSVYRFAIGVEDYKPSYAGDLSWVDEADEGFLFESTRLGVCGFRFARFRRTIREYLSSKTIVRKTKKGSHRVSAFDILMTVLRWSVLISGAASLICAVTVLSFPFSAIAGIYGLIVAMFIARNL